MTLLIPKRKFLVWIIAMVMLSVAAHSNSEVEDLYNEFSEEFTDVPAVDVKEYLQTDSGKDWVLLDVRPEEEREVSMLPQATSLQEFKRNFDQYQDKNVLVYCTVGYRSAVSTRSLRAEGIKAFNLKGGILSWVDAGQPVLDESGDETKKVHVYGRKWNVLPPEFEGIW